MAEDTPQGGPSEFVTFTIGDQLFCIDIMSLKEIRGWSEATPLPDTPDYVLGVVNLRGTVLPIIDLARRFGLERTAPTDRSVIMVTQVDGRLTGLLADAVSDIIMIQSGELQPAPAYPGDDRNGFVSGLVAREDRMISLVSLTEIVGGPIPLAA
ncbi:MAG: chemotaxis protein CheW [Litorimonas sp.]